ncbi:MAG: DUF1844 domain-containing protein [Pyrinomonadaceae bacterium MAG19_C2-C3]|nr:DUF1844 domain-containing protein [Pyrinomonadaceae bacterium MAG19_C2-C3]
MSEETPTFKVTDRRLFNSDGSPRKDVAREPKTETSDIGDAARSDQPSAFAPPVAANDAVSSPSLSPTATEQSAASDAARNSTDPLFLDAVMLIAQQAAAMMSGHPQFGGEVNLPEAKLFLDMLASIRAKAKGNLSTEEQQTFDSLLSQLRMQFVQLQQESAAPRGFSASDITGGK